MRDLSSAATPTKTLPIKAAYVFGAEKGLGPEVDAIRDLEIEWDKPYTTSLRRGYIVALFDKHGLFERSSPSFSACLARHLAQCDINTGTVIVRNMLRVTPPSTNSRKRECP